MKTVRSASLVYGLCAVTFVVAWVLVNTVDALVSVLSALGAI